MSKRPRHTTRAPPDGDKEPLTFTTWEATAREVEKIARREGVSVDTLIHEAMAFLFRDQREPIPKLLADYLEKHNRNVPRPLPPLTKRDLN